MPFDFTNIQLYNPSLFYDYGDVCIRNGELVVYIGNNHWEIIGTWCEIPKPMIEEIFFHCKSCGAPTKENGVCPYCETINKKVKKYA